MTTSPGASADKAPLEDLMVAMDVVDTLRHRDLIVDRELEAEGRRQRLLDRLRDIYEAQGIEVSDAALSAGVDALEEDRFRYTPTTGGFSVKLARLYVSRGRWLKPLAGVLALGLLIWIVWLFTVGLPEARLLAALPAKIEATHARITEIAASDAASERADMLFSQARQSLKEENREDAETRHEQLRALLRDLESAYEVRIVSRPNEVSAIWRVPDINPDARNYYLIVEAVTPSGSVIPLRVRNEEDGRTYQVSKWGLRVDQSTFETIADDKRDDGIVQDNIVGVKSVGQLDPVYRVSTTGGTITDW
ncbi:MAG: DUF6384 family protein [Gammaproteobacteria bacterium]|nr:DUF6384 family protein [Gammaproteobacteria bacterium]MDH3480154.1 DUF6384 family protein [Gammaproteobacteria bacterium]